MPEPSQNKHTNTGNGQHFGRLSCGVVVVRPGEGETLFLLLRAFNHWDFPKGMKENGESPIDAAVREVREETELTDLEFVWGDEYIETGPYSRGKVARYYIARTDKEYVNLPVNPEIGRPEHLEFRWASFDDAMRLASRRVQPVIRWAMRKLSR